MRPGGVYPSVLVSACNAGRLRLRCFVQTLVAFVVVGLLLKYTYDVEYMKQTPASSSSEKQRMSSNQKTLPIRSETMKDEEMTTHQDLTLLPIFKGALQLDATQKTEKPEPQQGFVTQLILQGLKTTTTTTTSAGTRREPTDDVSPAAEQFTPGRTVEETKENVEPFSDDDDGETRFHVTTSRSEVPVETVVQRTSAVNNSQTTDVLNSCGQMPRVLPLKRVLYDSEELESAFKRTSSTGRIWPKIKPAMTSEERDIVQMLLSELIRICHLHNITNYFIFSGTMLGSFRHHGLQPWDDDVDILMQYSDQHRILDVFRRYAAAFPEFVVKFIYERMKLFHRTRSVRIAWYEHRWPFLDISFYRENATHIWELYVNENMKYHETPKAMLFPLHLRPFEGVMINSPRDSYGILKSLFLDDRCVSLTWLHKSEVAPPSANIAFPCETVATIYPFVHRRRSMGAGGSCIEESLWLNGTILYTVLIEEPTYAISKPFTLQLEPH